jgi:hypothetical protein
MNDYAPGGRMDATQQAATHAQAADYGGADLGTDVASFVVPTADAMPEEVIPRLIVLGPNNVFLPVVPRDAARRRALLLAIDNDVVLVESLNLAQQLAAQVVGGAAAASLVLGAYLPKGIPVTLESRDLMYAVATTTTGPSRITTIVERYARTTV